MPRFPSREWAEEFCKAINESEGYRRSAKGWVWPILFKVTDLPDELRKIYAGGNPGMKVELDNGVCKGVAWYDDSEGVDSPYIISAKYSDWLDVINGKVHPVSAFVRRRLKLEKGSFATIMRYSMAAVELVKCAQKVGIE